MGQKINLKFLMTALIMLLLVTSVYSIKVVKKDSAEPIEQGTARGLAYFLVLIFVLGGLGFTFTVIFIWVIIKIYSKLTEINRKKKDFLFEMFNLDSIQCHINRDSTMKYRNWKFIWVFFKRKPVFVNTQNGFECIGLYNGQAVKKEGFITLSLFQKIGIFKSMEQILMIPIEIQHIMKKMTIEKNNFLVIDCDNIDTIGDIDTYLQPLITLDKRKDQKVLDLADYIYVNYIEKRVYRDVIKENLQSYRSGVITSVEANPNIHFNRRKPKQ